MSYGMTIPWALIMAGPIYCHIFTDVQTKLSMAAVLACLVLQSPIEGELPV